MPSTWPCIRWPPRRVCGVTARSRLTCAPAATEPRLLRLSVSAMTSVLQTPSATSVTVRQTPLTAMESPRATSCSTRSARIRSTAASDWSSRTTRVPTSSTIPVNTSTPPVRGLLPTSVPGGAQPDRHVPAQESDVGDREGQRAVDPVNSQVADQGGPGTEQLGCEMDHDLVDQPRAQESGGQRGPALQQDPADVAVVELGQQRRRITRGADQGGRGVVADASGRRDAVSAVDDDPQRLSFGIPPLRVAHRELRVVGQRRPGSDDDGVAAGPQPVDGGARLGTGDPAARAASRGGPARPGRRPLPDPLRTPLPDAGQP